MKLEIPSRRLYQCDLFAGFVRDLVNRALSVIWDARVLEFIEIENEGKYFLAFISSIGIKIGF